MANIDQDNTQKTIDTFFSVSRALKSKLNYKNPLLQLPLVQMQVLHFVYEQKQATMKAVSDFLSITPPSATALVNNLVDQQYLERIITKEDRRAVHLKLTKKGIMALKKAMKENCLRLSKLLSKLNAQEKLQFLQLLTKLAK